MNISNSYQKNPYDFTQPIYKKENLVGRDKIIRDIKNNFNHEIKITLLHVQRRIGKTSLITCLPQFFTEEQNNFEFVTFSFQGYKGEKMSQILNYLADDITSTILGVPKQVRETADSSYNFFNIFLPKVIDEYLLGKKLVLLLDEFDIFDEYDPVAESGRKLFEILEKAVKEQEKLFAILVFGRPLKDMKYLEKFLENLEKEGQKAIEVGLLNKEGTKKLIVKPAEETETLKYEDGAIDAIWKLSA
ncbi:MAG: ATP-binding protein, partial [Trichodesmium sp. St17_bin3_1_1]|nr:ATP-binding protein [Trichodesmium sp. St17_bin3_1_1]